MRNVKSNQFSRSQLSVFTLIFALIGTIILIKSFASPNPNLPGDLNNDNVVDISDISYLASRYHSTTDLSADINKDGANDLGDLSIIISHYGQSISGMMPQFWSTSSFINNPIPGTATLSPSSSTWINYLNSTNTALYINWSQWTTPIYHANSSTPSATFLIRNQNRHITFPYQSSFKQDNTTDGGIAIIDDSTGCVYEFESFDPAGQSANAEQTFRNIHTSSGVHANDSGVTGSDIAEIGGIITPQDINSGSINHALRLITNYNAPQYVAPASRSDGTHTGGIPEGTLLQLDPSLDLTPFNLNPFQMIVAKALQKYGAYDADSSGAVLLVTAENTQDGSSYKYTPTNLPGSLILHMRFLNPNIPTPSLDSRATTGCSQPF